MPRGNRMGPENEGPMTGRGLGYCAGANTPGAMNPGLGGAWRRGRGGRSGFRGRGATARRRPGGGRGFALPSEPTPEEELNYLEGDLEYLKREMTAAEERIAEIRKESEG